MGEEWNFVKCVHRTGDPVSAPPSLPVPQEVPLRCPLTRTLPVEPGDGGVLSSFLLRSTETPKCVLIPWIGTGESRV